MLVLDKILLTIFEKPLELAKNRIQKGLRPFTMEEDMTDQSDSKKITATYQTLFDMGMKALQRVGVPEPDARTTMDVLLCADLRGVASHGIQRLLQYVPRLRDRLINPHPRIVVEPMGPALKQVSGDNGLGAVVGTRGMKEAILLARESGIGYVGCRHSNHFGAAAPYVLLACQERMIGIAGSNAAPTMGPWGGLERLVGNNPLAIGVPCEGDIPFLLDMSMSVAARGKINDMARRKEKIPEGWALDPQGRPTTDPVEALKGFGLPFGQYKGYGLAVAVDILSGVLTGGGYSTDVRSLVYHWEEPTNVGHFFVVIDATRFMSLEALSERMKRMYHNLRGAPPITPDQPVLISGELEANLEKTRRQHGIPMDPKVFEILKGLAAGKYDYEIPKF